jgi:hypothetical protein
MNMEISILSKNLTHMTADSAAGLHTQAMLMHQEFLLNGKGWLNYTRDKAPTNIEKMHDWQKEHQPNLTGTVHAYRPKGSLARGGKRSKTASDYESWSPDD